MMESSWSVDNDGVPMIDERMKSFKYEMSMTVLAS